jgi:pSer/pThr/pTyr-binding forkhead associated (FHA) protein
MSPKFFLIIVKGPEIGEKYFFDKDVVNIGRNDENDLVLEDDSVSGQHARIIFKDGEFFIDDFFKSKNGIYYKGSFLKKGQSEILLDGSEFILGEVCLRYTAFIKLSLFIVKGFDVGKEFPLETDKNMIHIGRTAAHNDIIFTNPSISGKHVKITFEDGKFFLEDIGSTNGTYYKKERLQKGNKQQLRKGDEFTIGCGASEIVFRVEQSTGFRSGTAKKTVFRKHREPVFSKIKKIFKL